MKDRLYATGYVYVTPQSDLSWMINNSVYMNLIRKQSIL